MLSLKRFLQQLLFVLLVLTSFSLSAQTITNPLSLSDEWPGYSIGDPFVLKYRGIFYLYSSTKDNSVGVKCWSSKNLVNWTYRGLCSTDPVTKTAYAPEVTYWNGKFYMYTSPAGNGHFVLSSDSPTGPFVAITSNLGHVIDGSVFIDDDGKWYFYHADMSGIQGCPMPTPITIGSTTNLGARITNNWTEGPSIVKRNGVYYMIYTGNHVWSKGYRINYAMNSSGPLAQFESQDAQNPIVLSAEGAWTGLGHGSLFIGPDLDTYYITYHNIGSEGVPVRHLNFDRIAWDGTKMMVLGPTNYSQQAPLLPHAYDYFDRTEIGSGWSLSSGAKWSLSSDNALVQDSLFETEEWNKALLDSTTLNNYTAEFNVSGNADNTANSLFGALFSYKDEQNFGVLMVNSAYKTLVVKFLQNNVWSAASSAVLPADFDFTKWHNLKIEKQDNRYRFYIDNMNKINTTSVLDGGKCGYFTYKAKASFGFIASRNNVDGSAVYEVYKPVPGMLAATHYNAGGEGVGYHDLSIGNTGAKGNRADNVDVSDCSEGGFSITDNEAGEWYKYNVNVQTKALYSIGVRYATNSETCKVRFWLGDTDVSGIVTLPSTGGADVWKTFTIRNVELLSGYQTIKFEVVEGGFDVQSLQLVKTDASVGVKSDDFNTGTFNTSWNYKDGSWSVVNNEATINGFGKRAMGAATWTNYVVETDVKYLNGMNGGLIIRVKNPALGGAGNDASLGSDFLQGYFIGLSPTSVILGKQNYNWAQLTSASGTYDLQTWYHIKVVANGSNIKVYVGDMQNAKIDYTDTDPFIAGKVGLRVCNSNVTFDNFRVETFTDTVPSSVNTGIGVNEKSADFELSPNPVKDILYVKSGIDHVQYKVYNALGVTVMEEQMKPKCNYTVAVNNLTNGVYVLNVTDKNGTIENKRFLKQ
jgi:intracellular sulfur oxidation DsrE/DsrF family protein